MSYSRWLDSMWYTYWSVYSGKTKKTQCLEIMVDFDRCYCYSYKKLTTELENICEKIKTECKATNEEIEELKSYINSFIENVNNNYNLIKKIVKNLKRRKFRKEWKNFKKVKKTLDIFI